MSVLTIHGLSKRFGGLVVCDGVDLSFDRGERVALIGPNGAGKTTLVNLVTGQLGADAGRIVLAGRDVTRRSSAARARAGLLRSFQVSRLFPTMTPAEHVAMALLQRLGRAGRMVGDWRTMPDVVAEVGQVLDQLGLAAQAAQPVAALAYGQQRLVEIALALALRPQVLLLDEPAAGVPAGDVARIEAALDRLPADLTVLMVEHDMDLVFRFARRVVVMVAGAVIFDGPPAAAAADPGVRAAYLGGSVA